MKRKIARRIKLEAWIDAGHGSCVLRKSEIASAVQNSLLHFHEKRYYLHAWVVMPNHFHALFRPLEEWTMAKIVSSWKRFTGRKIGDYLRAAGELGVRGSVRSSAPIWHREYWDRYIRDEEHFWDTVEYIHNNPVKAGLVKRPEDWLWSSAVPGKKVYEY